MIYVFNIITIIMYYIAIKHIKGVNKKHTFLLLCMFQMTLIVGLRYNVGADYKSYYRIFELIESGQAHLTNVELGYKLLNEVLCYLGGTYYTVNIVIAALTFLFIILAIDRLSVDYFYSVYLYITLFFFYHAMNQTRQQLAIAIEMYAISYIEKKQLRYFVLWTIIASLFHTSVIVFLVMYFLKNISISKKTLILYLGVTAGLLGMMEVLIRIIRTTRYGLYFSMSYGTEAGKGIIINTIVRAILLTLVLWRCKYIENTYKKNSLYHMALICMLFQILTMRISLFGRLTTSFFVSYIFLIPEIIRTIPLKYRKMVWQLGILCGGIYNYVYYYYMNANVLVNSYQSIWNMKSGKM